MKFTIKSFLFSALLLWGASFQTQAQSQNFLTGKALENQYNILRTLQTQYVDTIDIDKLITTGINAMLESLDPYTVYIPEENEEEIDIMTTGSYGGVGSIIKKLPSGEVLINEPYIDSPSSKAGLLPGDLILAVEGVSTHDLSSTECSKRMRGEPGTVLTLTIKKTRTGDTVDVKITRERVHVSDVVYYGMVQDTIGYIQIGGFTLDGAKDVKKALENLKASGKMKRLILDLRGNGGGLMPEAVDIVSLFVPSGTMVVSQKGKIGESKYYTDKEPVDTEIPLMVLVNSGSASSSEIVSGALQDLDRAVIAGIRTFGKGLVQNIRPVGYNNSLKVTIAKYYTPSGRCVQAIDYSHRNEDGSVGYVPDSLRREFKTASGRSVYDGGGITPDIIVEPKYYNRPMVALIYSDILSDYAIDYFRTHENPAPAGSFSITDEEYDRFVAYASKKEFDQRTEAQIEMEGVIAAAKREGLYDKYKADFDNLLDKVSFTREEYLKDNKEDLKLILEQEICVKYYFQRGGAENALRNDSQLYTAIKNW